MAQVGDSITNPLARMTLRFTATAASSDGELVEVEATYEPGSAAPIEHFHPDQDEHFELRTGTMRARIDGAERELRAGETLDVPRGTVHAMWNPGAEPATLLWQTRPALRTESFFEDLAELASSGNAQEMGAKGAELLAEYRDVFRLPEPEADNRPLR